MPPEKKKFKLPKIGEGDRERRPSKYGEGGREVGGQARKLKNKAMVSKVFKDDLPPPGGHPQKLRDKAAEKGFKPPPGPAEKGAGGPGEGGRLDPEDLDGLFQAFKVERRPVRAREEKRLVLADQRNRSELLREPAEEPAEERPEAEEAEKRHLPIVSGEPQNAAAKAAEKRSAKRTKYHPEQEEALAGILNLPGVVCNRCTIAEMCEHFKENATCAYEEDLSALTTRDLENAIPSLEQLADIQLRRARRAAMYEERATGGQIDPNVTRQIEIAAQSIERIARLKGAFAPEQSLTLTATESRGEGGIVSRLIASLSPAALPNAAAAEGGGKAEENPAEKIEAEYEVVEILP